MPIIGRLDGVAFHTLAKQLKLIRPFDTSFSTMMAKATQVLTSHVQGCMLAYTQSDEISFIMRTDQSTETTPWFDNRVQKISSVAASIVSASFNRQLSDTYGSEIPCAAFDCRVYGVPDLVEVLNYFIWRQNDCTKNSISSAAYFELSKLPDLGKKTAQKLLHGLNQDERQELLWQKTYINWNDYDPKFKRGVAVVREEKKVETPYGIAIRKPWTIKPAPIFSSDGGRDWFFSVVDPKDDEKYNGQED
jgi:tRNA(His) 5'-end guanylyltransferase